mgnify:CR=1 FL=1
MRIFNNCLKMKYAKIKRIKELTELKTWKDTAEMKQTIQ